jgi:hypothetical protein
MPVADPLREKLKALVEDLRPPLEPDESKNDRYWLGWDDALTEVLDLLAESKPNPGKTHYQGDDCPGGHESKCGYCGAKCGWCSIEQRCPHGAGDGMCPVLGCGNYPGEPVLCPCESCELAAGISPEDSYPKPVLKLGHEFIAALDSLGRSSKSDAYCCGECGQPREAR